MGILGYPNMDDNNHDGIFGGYSEVYSNYPDENNGLSNTSEEKQVGETSQADASPYDVDGVVQADVQQAKNHSSGRLVFYLLVLGLLLAGAVGMYFYKQKADASLSQEQSMGDYFYDQVQNNAMNANQDVATVEVNLGADTVAEPNVSDKAVVANVDGKNSVEVLSKKEALSHDGQKNGNIAKDDASSLIKADAKKKEIADREKQLTFSSVTIPVTSGGRADPFLPVNLAKAAVETSRFELIAPPAVIPEADPLVDALMSVKISGIMFDSARPSAIININGVDQLVHKGDIVRGYKINDITKESVVIQYKSNIYQVTVGQTLNDGLNINPVSNLSSSFGGSYSKPAVDLIEIGN